jgi:hypothetical protein
VISGFFVTVTKVVSGPCFRLSPDIIINESEIFTIEIIVNVCIDNRTVLYYSILFNEKKCLLFSLIRSRHQWFLLFIWRLSRLSLFF